MLLLPCDGKLKQAKAESKKTLKDSSADRRCAAKDHGVGDIHDDDDDKQK